MKSGKRQVLAYHFPLSTSAALFNLPYNLFRCPERVRGSRDRPSHDKVIRSRCNGFRRCVHARLVRFGSACRTDSRSNNHESSAQVLPDKPRLMGRSDHSAATAVLRQRSENQGMVPAPSCHADFLQVGVGKTGQDGDRQDKRRLRSLPSGFDSGAQHGRAACGMDGKHRHPQPCRRAHCPGCGIGDVMKFQIQEYPLAGGY